MYNNRKIRKKKGGKIMRKINWLKLAIEVVKVVIAFFAGTQM